jgi:hypothetical protein
VSSSEGALRRRIEIATRGGPQGPGEARAAVEDTYHHFRVIVRFDEGRVTGAQAQSLRFPFSSCPAASGQLVQLEGMALSSVSSSVTKQTDASIHCTHMLDLAGLAIAAAARGIARRRYDCLAPDRVDEITHPSLLRDGQPLLSWTVEHDEIIAPEPYAGHGLRQGFAGWALRNLSEDEAEAAIVLRRATNISIGRRLDLYSKGSPNITGFCYSQQAEYGTTAVTQQGFVIETPDFEQLCLEDGAFIAFAD